MRRRGGTMDAARQERADAGTALRRPAVDPVVLTRLMLCAIASGPATAVAQEAGSATAAAVSGRTDAPALPKPKRPDLALFQAMLAREAASRGLPPAVADAVAYVESGYDPGATGGVGELGLMQVRPTTAAMLGHTGPAAALLDPATNIRFGVAYLAQAWKLANGDLCRAPMKYRAGHDEERMSPRSVAYCQRARLHLAASGSPLAAAALPAASAGAPATGSEVRNAAAEKAARSAAVRRLWAEHVSRIRRIEARIGRVMGGG